MPQENMKDTESGKEPQRRRSARLSPLQANQQTGERQKMAPAAAGAAGAAGAALVKRSITVRKIAPRKTTLQQPSQHNKENTPKRAASEGVLQKKQKLSTPENVPARNSSSGKKPKKSTMPSPILPSPPLPLTSKSPKVQTPKTRSRSSKVQPENQDQADPADLVWSQKVRRSYSRLSDRSFSSPDSRIGLFGFEQLQTPEVMRKGQNNNNSSRSGLEVSGSFSALVSFSSMVEAEDCGAEPDPNIPGVALVKEKRRRKKVQQMDSNEVEALAAKMNAEFEEAEEFQLLVE